jgi:hypothetical protein
METICQAFLWTGLSRHLFNAPCSQAQTPIGLPILFVGIAFPCIVDQIPVAIHASLLIAGSCIEHGPVGQHGPPLVGDIEDIPVALLTLIIPERGIGLLPVLLMVIVFLDEMDDDVLDAVSGLGIEEIKGIVGGREVAVHAVGNKPLCIVHMGGGLPGMIGKTNLVAGGAKLGCGGADHGII